MTLIHSPDAPTTAQQVGTWHDVCHHDDLEHGWGEAALIDGQQVALFRLRDEGLFAVHNRDPRTGSFVMSRGIVGSRAGRPTIASPLLKDVFDLETGVCLTKPELTLPIFPVRAIDGVVQVLLHSDQVPLSSSDA